MCTVVCKINVARLMRKIHVIGSTLGPRGARERRENLLYSSCATQTMGKGKKGGERKVPGALLRTKRNNSMGTPVYHEDQKSMVMHRLIYQ